MPERTPEIPTHPAATRRGYGQARKEIFRAMCHAIPATISLLLALAGCAAGPGTHSSPVDVASRAELLHVASLTGSPVPQDVREPHMPGVDLLSDMDLMFALARAATADVGPGSARRAGARQVIIVTPARMGLAIGTDDTGRMPMDPAEHAASILGAAKSLDIAVIGFTAPEALVEAPGRLSIASANRAIPFLGHLGAFAQAGHAIVVFEGHPSAFEAGVRNVDILLVDSAMQPFLQSDWQEVAWRAMKPGARIIVHDRASYTLRELAKPPGGRPPALNPAGA